MRERAALPGSDFSAGPRPGRRFRARDRVQLVITAYQAGLFDS